MAPPPAEPDTEALLRTAGLRVTEQRRFVLSWLATHPHSTAEQIRVGVRGERRSISTQAVYDILHACTEAGLVRVIQPAGMPAIFERRVGDNHHHLLCRRCGRTDDVDCVVGAAPCLSPDDDQGFAVGEAEIVFWGVCPRCRSNHQEERNQ
jgi:Fur family transcriptional regulator, stress-responsive regulator